jgi:hypothetical protein
MISFIHILAIWPCFNSSLHFIQNLIIINHAKTSTYSNQATKTLKNNWDSSEYSSLKIWLQEGLKYKKNQNGFFCRRVAIHFCYIINRLDFIFNYFIYIVINRIFRFLSISSKIGTLISPRA